MSKLAELRNRKSGAAVSPATSLDSSSAVSSKTVNEIRKFFEDPFTEVEIKFKSKITPEFANNFKTYLSSLLGKPKKTEYTTESYENGYRSVITGSTREYELKARNGNHDFNLDGVDFRISSSAEKKVDKETFETKKSGKKYVRNIVRESYVHGNIRYDLSSVGGDVELEIERLNSDCQVHEFTDALQLCYFLYKHPVHILKCLPSLQALSQIQKDLSKPADITNSTFDEFLLSKFSVTLKLDGDRQLLIICNNIIFTADARASTGVLWNPVASGVSVNNLEGHIFEGERTSDGVFHAFDFLGTIEGGRFNTSNLKFDLNVRLDFVKKLESAKFPVKAKSFSSGKFSEVCAKILADADKSGVANDGLIFQFNGADRKIAYKWKPSSHLTIDFYLHIRENGGKECDEIYKDYTKNLNEPGLYIDSSKGAHKEFGFIAPMKDVSFPKGKTASDFACNVVECSYENNKWIVKRIRNKLPNHETVYRRIWNLIENPITRETIEGKNMVMMMKLHNSVKRSILSTLPHGAVILDVGSGQGGDIDKWANFSKVYAVEPDPVKHAEFERRLKLKPADVQKKITLIKSGFETVDPKIIEKADFVIGFFSFTFFFKDQGKLDPVILRQLSHMKKGAELIGIVLDGDKVSVAMKGKTEASCKDEWWIRKKSAKSHTISTFIKGSDYIDGSFEENIVYVKKFVALLEQNGFKKSIVESFARNLMTECNQSLSDLNTFFRFAKNSKPITDDDDVNDYVERDDDVYVNEGDREDDRGSSDESGSESESDTDNGGDGGDFEEDDERVETDEFVPQAYREIDGEDSKPIEYPTIGQLVFNDQDDKMHNDYFRTNVDPLVFYLGVPTDRLNIIHAANVATLNAKFGAVFDKLMKNYLAYSNNIIDKEKFIRVKSECELVLADDTEKLLFSSDEILKTIIDKLTLKKFLELNEGYLAGGFQHRILAELEKESRDVDGIHELNKMAHSAFIDYLLKAELGERSMMELLCDHFKKNIYICTIIKGQLKLVKSFSSQNMNASSEDRVLLFTPDGVTFFPAAPTDQVKSLKYDSEEHALRTAVRAGGKKAPKNMKQRIQALNPKEKRYILTRLSNGIDAKNKNVKLDKIIDEYAETFTGKGTSVDSLIKLVTSGEETFEVYKNLISAFVVGDVKKFQQELVFAHGLKSFFADKFFEIGKAIASGVNSDEVADMVTEVNTTRSVDDIFKQLGQTFIGALINNELDVAKRIHYLVGGKIFKMYKKKKSVSSERRYEYFPVPEDSYLGKKFEINMKLDDFLELNNLDMLSLSFTNDAISRAIAPFSVHATRTAVARARADARAEVEAWTDINDIPQMMKYDSKKANKNLKIHNGQKKLYLCELQYLVEKIGRRGVDTSQSPVFIVYAGAAPAHSRYDLAEMFPNVKFVMVDPNEFKINYTPKGVASSSSGGSASKIVYEFPSNDLIHDKVLYIKEGEAYASKDPNKKYKNTTDYKEAVADGENLSEFIANSAKGRFFIIEDYYTVRLSEQLRQLNEFGEVHFWSDIRTADDDAGKTPLDIDILWNSAQHALWIDALKPAGAMLKFRIPFKNDGDDSVKQKYKVDPYKSDFNAYEKLKGYPSLLGDYENGLPFKYYDGEVKLQTWARESSAETRLWIDLTLQEASGSPRFRTYDSEEYEGKLFYFNSVVRPNGVYFKNDHADNNMHFDHCANCALEDKIISDYYTKVAGVTDKIELNRRVKDKVLHLIKVSGNRGLDANGHGKFF
jgi:hypothetical protein